MAKIIKYNNHKGKFTFVCFYVAPLPLWYCVTFGDMDSGLSWPFATALNAILTDIQRRGRSVTVNAKAERASCYCFVFGEGKWCVVWAFWSVCITFLGGCLFA